MSDSEDFGPDDQSMGDYEDDYSYDMEDYEFDEPDIASPSKESRYKVGRACFRSCCSVIYTVETSDHLHKVVSTLFVLPMHLF